MLAPQEKEAESYITLKPIYDFENKEPYAQNSMINIYTTQIVPEVILNLKNGLKYYF